MFVVRSISFYRAERPMKSLGLLDIIMRPKLFSTKSRSKPSLKKDSSKISPIGWFLLAVPVTTFGLGTWQVKRKVWKENLIRELDEKTKSAPVPLPENLEEVTRMEYRPVKVRGKFLHDKELFIGPRSLIHPATSLVASRGRDDNIGYQVVTPFKLSGREETILVNRGWIPKRCMNSSTREEGQIPNEVELIGVVRLNENRPQFSPDHKGDTYLYRDLKRMCAQTGADPIFIDANYESSVPGGPVGGQTRVTLRNEHLSYIFTWYSLSAATAFMWYRQIWRRKGF